jgi:hypothetical protein
MKESTMVKTARLARDKPSAPAKEALKRQKKQARREVKLMLAIEEAKKDLKKAEKKQAKAQARLEAQSTSLHTLEARLAELRFQIPEPESVTPPDSAGLEHQQEPFELESSLVRSNGEQLASPDQERQGEIGALPDQAVVLPQVEDDIGTASSSSETGASSSTDELQRPPLVEEKTPSEAMVATKDMTEAEAVQEKDTTAEIDPSQTPTTPGKAHAQKTATTRKSTAPRRPASRSRSNRQSPSDAG